LVEEVEAGDLRTGISPRRRDVSDDQPHSAVTLSGDATLFFYGTQDAYVAFSNFAPYPMTLKGAVWPTSEHYFQAQNTPAHPTKRRSA
jgi:predicted NAD-dependent protein-ADP-ribosyltransferase YbiA (DUF1768 family)